MNKSLCCFDFFRSLKFKNDDLLYKKEEEKINQIIIIEILKKK